MANDERLLQTLPTGALGLIPLESFTDMGQKVDKYLVKWRAKREHKLSDTITRNSYKRDTYIVEASCPRFGSGEAKGVIKESVQIGRASCRERV